MKSLCVAFESKDFDSCEKLLTPIKIDLIKHDLLLPDLQSENEAYINDLNVSKMFLEIGALVNIYRLDFDAFKSYFVQVRVYYFGNNSKLSESENKSKLISLYLLVLLSEGEITKFHSELEYLGKHVSNLEEDELLSYPTKVEKWLMEGSYQKACDLLESKSKIPEFDIFTETLMNAIRDEIARNAEIAYKILPLTNIKALLFFNSEKESEKFALERGWKIVNGSVIFEEEENTDQKKETQSIIERSLDYAISLETIV